MTKNLPEIFIEVDYFQKNKAGNQVCGDSFMSQKLKGEGRIIGVLSDGLGSGIKARVLSAMTATMAMNYTALNETILRTARSIIDTLPKDEVKQIGYSTFCILDIDCFGNTKIIEYETPSFYLFRKGESIKIQKQRIPIERPDLADSYLWISEFRLEKEDRLVCFTDGVSQSGMGSEKLPAGWESQIEDYIQNLLLRQVGISAEELSRRIVIQAEKNDGYNLIDDASCCVVYNRTPRNLLVCTGPPYDPQNDSYLAIRVKEFRGKKVICGGTTASLLARELHIPIKTLPQQADTKEPPISSMDGIDLVTEGILTLSRVERILSEEEHGKAQAEGAAEQLVKLLHNSDQITFIVGTCINIAHQDPNLPVELEIRRNVVKKIKYLLETKFLKDVEISYL
ncbi:PP2C family serine/threonine-protein phosphatase [Odoribacter laneus]|uniref:PP2C family serine/threonine-protein phosphatase n=1 Tax=Odoribacter laneus TaxID=626933 RepID=UPI00033C45CA|nr:PP2C family serine/threonine-protein phosphatase [Odoribacter laneus]CCZ81142.1 putative uncharacterized protein [Odoribacter laneus CAG:561]